MKHWALLWLAIAGPCQLAATVYYVSQPTGNDSNNGLSINAPFKTIQKAADLVQPGDVVNVMNGTYTNSCAQCDVVNITRAGTAAAWITFQNYAGHAPVLSFTGWQGFKLGNNARYIRITGFEVVGNNSNVTLADALNQPSSCNNPGGSPNPIYNGNGIAADGRNLSQRPHHIQIDNNIVHDCGGAGISAIQSDYVTVENNLIYNNSWYTIYATSGISFWQLWNSDGTTNTHNFVRRNRCFGNRLYVPWLAGCQITDGNGIIIDDSRNTQNGSTLGAYTARTLVENNVVWNNGGSGIHTYESEHVTIVHNTAYQNSQSPDINGGEIFANSSNDVLIVNNILWAPAGNVLNSNYSNTNLTYDYNLHFGGTGAALTGAHTLTGDPRFVQPEATLNADFHLQPGSPAINSGDNNNSSAGDFDGNLRPYASVVDLGAFEKLAPLPVEYLSALQARAVPQGVLLDWSTATEREAAQFLVERSTNATDFIPLGTVKARGGNVATNYRYLDAAPVAGFNYYRLRQTDLDGQSHLSQVVAVDFKSLIFKAFPNPTTDQLEVDGIQSWERTVLKNALGQPVRTADFGQGMSLKGLPIGVYVLEIWVDQVPNPTVLRVVKQ